MPDKSPSDEEKLWGWRDHLLKKNAENNLDGTWNQWEILKEDGNKKNSYT